MAIIYTYPKLTNPQGNELIVVSDVNNRNSTRLITIASIASLVPSGGGCATAITGIVDEAGDPLYTPPACSDMELISSDGSVSISSAPTGINLTVDTGSEGCTSAYNEILGTSGNIITSECDGTAIFDVDPDSSMTIQGDGTTLTWSLNCPTPTNRGGITANTISIPTPAVADEGTYYPIEVLEGDCLAVVKVPDSSGGGCSDVFKTITTSGGTFSFDASGCNDTLTLTSAGGSVSITSLAQGSVNFEVGSIPCATTTTRGGIIVGTDNTGLDPVVDEGGTAYAVEVNTSCEAFVRVPSSGGGGEERGWSPLSIYEASQPIPNDLGLMVQSVAEATIIGMNRVDFFIMNLPAPTPGDVGRFDIYSGTIQSGGTWLGGGLSSGSGVSGVQTITLTEPVNITAGQKYVLYWRLVGDNFAVAGSKAGSLVDQNLALATTTPGGVNIPANDLAEEIEVISGNPDIPEALLRIAHTMYKA